MLSVKCVLAFLSLPLAVRGFSRRSYPGARDVDEWVYLWKGNIDIMRDEVKNVDYADYLHYRISDGPGAAKPDQYAEFYVRGPAVLRLTQFDITGEIDPDCKVDYLQFMGTKFCTGRKPSDGAEFKLSPGEHLFRYRTSSETGDDHEGFVIEVEIKKSDMTTTVAPPAVPTEEFSCADQAVIDFFLLQDVTQSYKNDLHNLIQKLPSLFQEMNDTFILPRFGLSTFADKPIRPFGSSRSEDFCYQLLNPLTNSRTEAEAAVKKLIIHSGLDWKESQLDGMMAAALQEDSNWRNYDFYDVEGETLPVVRLLVLATDAGFHLAGDGASVGLTTPKNSEGNVRCLEEDYPSIEQVIAALRLADVSPLFIVTSDVLPLYTELAVQIEEAGVPSFAVALKDDSSDIIDAIREGLGVLCSRAAHKKLERL